MMRAVVFLFAVLIAWAQGCSSEVEQTAGERCQMMLDCVVEECLDYLEAARECVETSCENLEEVLELRTGCLNDQCNSTSCSVQPDGLGFQCSDEEDARIIAIMTENFDNNGPYFCNMLDEVTNGVVAGGAGGGGGGCCRRCSTGKPCGNSCIAAHLNCTQPPGCA